MTLIRQIHLSAANPDVNAAVKPIREMLGDRGHAMQFFSGAFADDWPHQTEEERQKVLLNYIDEALAVAF